MTAALRAPSDSPDLALSEEDFRAIAALVHGISGLALGPAKRGLVVARLGRRLRALGLPDFASYRALVCGPDGAAERGHLVSALTTNVTRFFREGHHFEMLRAQVLPPLVARARAGGRVRLWSAGCSTGEEAYSIALLLHEACPDAARLDIRILATDIDPQVLARAEAGLYPAAALEGIPPRLHRAGLVLPGDLSGHATGHPSGHPSGHASGHPPGHAAEPAAPAPGTGPGGQRPPRGPGALSRPAVAGGFAIAPAVRAILRFAPLNLLAPWPMRGLFDTVFCRNVVIYFDAPTQARLWPRLAARMRPGATLFIGHSERVGQGAAPLFRPCGTTSYRRTETPVPQGEEP